MMRRQPTHCLLVLTLAALLVCVAPVSQADRPPTVYAHEFEGVSLEALIGEQPPSLVCKAIESALPDAKAVTQAQEKPNLVGPYEDWGDKGRLLKQDAAGYGTVHGYVKDAKTNKPIKGAKVKVVGYSLSARTNSSGYYKITKVPAGNRTIKASKRGYITQRKKVTVRRNRKHLVNFFLKKGATLTVRPKSQCIKPNGIFEYRVIGSGFTPGEWVHLWHVGPNGVKQEFGTHRAYFGRIDATVQYSNGWTPGYYTMHAQGLTSKRHPTARFQMRKC